MFYYQFPAPSPVVMRRVESLSPESIFLQWNAPAFPNGQVTHYRIAYKLRPTEIPLERSYCAERERFMKHQCKFKVESCLHSRRLPANLGGIEPRGAQRDAGRRGRVVRGRFAVLPVRAEAAAARRGREWRRQGACGQELRGAASRPARKPTQRRARKVRVRERHSQPRLRTRSHAVRFSSLWFSRPGTSPSPCLPLHVSDCILPAFFPFNANSFFFILVLHEEHV